MSNLSKVKGKRECEEKLTRKWERVNEEGVEDLEEDWRKFTEIILETVREVIEINRIRDKKIRNGREWWSEEVREQ